MRRQCFLASDSTNPDDRAYTGYSTSVDVLEKKVDNNTLCIVVAVAAGSMRAIQARLVAER